MEREAEKKDYRSYEYKQVVVREKQLSFCVDCYRNLAGFRMKMRR